MGHESSFSLESLVIRPSPTSLSSLHFSCQLCSSTALPIGPSEIAQSQSLRIVCQGCMQIVVYCISGPTCLVGSMNLYCKHFKQPARAQRNFVPTCIRQGGHARTQTCRTLSCL